MLAEWQNEYGSDRLILMRARGGGGEKMSSGLELFLLRRDLVFLFASYTKCTVAFTPVLDIFSWQNRILDFFFLQTSSRPPQ